MATRALSRDLRPFLRWAGGKRRIVPSLLRFFPPGFDGRARRFFEPFVGGGALAIALGDPAHPYYVPGENLFINDANPDLILAYKALRDHMEELVEHLARLAVKKDRAAYEKVRNSMPTGTVPRAARFIYLNKTCFNGLWRVNARGAFNVPFGRLKNPTIYDEQNLHALNRRLQCATITCEDFEVAVEAAREGDLVYFDPPYIPLTLTSSFSQYAKEGFRLEDQHRLASLIGELTARGVQVLLSNSSTPLTEEIFSPVVEFRQILVKRSISASPASRASVAELIGTNFSRLR